MGRVSTFTKAAWLSVVLLHTAASQAGTGPQKESATERLLSASGRRYLLCDFANRRFVLKQLGAVLREYPFQVIDSQYVEMAGRRSGVRDSSSLAVIRESVVLEATGRHSDTVVAVVARTTNADPERIQRLIPGRMILVVGDDLVFDIVTETEGKPTSFWQNALKSLSVRLQRLVRASHVIPLQMKGSDAMSLAGAAEPGLTVLLSPE